jgi:membrane protein DedA with SNARE-associated domain
MLDAVLNAQGLAAYTIVFALLLASAFGLPIPEDLSLIAAGILVHSDRVYVLPMAVICYVGLVLGDVVIYRLGRLAGPAVFRRRWTRRYVTATRLQIIRHNLERRTFATILVARHLFYLRTVTFLLCGAVRVNFLRFLLADGVAALVTTPLMMGLGYLFAEHYEALFGYIKQVKILLVVLGVIVGCAILVLYLRSRHDTYEDELEVPGTDQ